MNFEIPFLVFHIESTKFLLVDDDPGDYIYPICGRIAKMDDDESDKLVGKFRLYYVDIAAAINTGYISVFDIFDTPVTWDTDSKQKDKIERMWRFGFSFMQPMNFMNSQLFILYDVDTKYEGNWHLGGEILYESMFALRAGSNDDQFTAGAGVAYWKLKVDYAYQHYDLGNTHRVGVTFIF